MRTLHLIGSKTLGGAERWFIRFTQAMAGLGEPTHAFVRRGSDLVPIDWGQVDLEELPMRTVWDPLSRHEVRRAMRRIAPDLVQTYMGRATRLTHLGGRPVHVARLGSETREIRYKGRDIGALLDLSIDEAVQLFAAHPSVHQPLILLRDVSVGYLTLGQPSPTLSGCEAQRIQLVTGPAKAQTRPDAGQAARGAQRKRTDEQPGPRTAGEPTLYLLDEPTVGLHMADVERLVHVLQRLVDAGHGVLVIGHNLDLLAETDWLVDLGPEGATGAGTASPMVRPPPWPGPRTLISRRH